MRPPARPVPGFTTIGSASQAVLDRLADTLAAEKRAAEQQIASTEAEIARLGGTTSLNPEHPKCH